MNLTGRFARRQHKSDPSETHRGAQVKGSIENRVRCPQCGAIMGIPEMPLEVEGVCYSLLLKCLNCGVMALEVPRELIRFTSHPKPSATGVAEWSVVLRPGS